MTGENKAADILRFIREFRARHKYSPSVREIRDGVGISSTSMTHRWLSAMAKRGLVTWAWGKGRTIRVIDD